MAGEYIHGCNLRDASRHENDSDVLASYRSSSVMIHTHRRYCISAGWMTDGDRSREVEVRCEQENRKGWSIQHTGRVAE